jgi:hypothetical protein
MNLILSRFAPFFPDEPNAIEFNKSPPEKVVFSKVGLDGFLEVGTGDIIPTGLFAPIPEPSKTLCKTGVF